MKQAMASAHDDDARVSERFSVATKGLSTDRFVKAFIAELVLADIQAIPPRDSEVRRGLSHVVEKIDTYVRELLENGVSISDARPWIEASNQLRLSPTGGVENWERAFRAAQLTFTQIGNPSYEIVTFVIDKPRAKSELANLDKQQLSFVHDIATTFVEQVHGRA
jgi:hypothetical protein